MPTQDSLHPENIIIDAPTYDFYCVILFDHFCGDDDDSPLGYWAQLLNSITADCVYILLHPRNWFRMAWHAYQPVSFPRCGIGQLNPKKLFYSAVYLSIFTFPKMEQQIGIEIITSLSEKSGLFADSSKTCEALKVHVSISTVMPLLADKLENSTT